MDKLFVNPTALESVMKDKNLTDVTLAELMDMDRTTIFKAKNGSPVGGKFVANLLRVAADKTFADLFFMSKPLR